MTVFNRSNDFFRGFAYDVFAFGGIQAYLSERLGVTPGRYLHLTDSLHVYERDHRAVCAIARQNNPEQLGEALETLPRLPPSKSFCGITVPAASESATDHLRALELAFGAWKSGRAQAAFDALIDSEAGLAAILYLAGKRGFENCNVPAWFQARTSPGLWRM
jgi:hypothetical protein